MIYEYLCGVCKKQFDEIRSYEKRHEVFHCGQRATKLVSCGSIDFFNTKPIQRITKSGEMVTCRTRKEYRDYLRKNGLADATPRECLSIKPKSNVARTKRMAQRITERCKQDGILESVPKFLKDTGILKPERR